MRRTLVAFRKSQARSARDLATLRSLNLKRGERRDRTIADAGSVVVSPVLPASPAGEHNPRWTPPPDPFASPPPPPSESASGAAGHHPSYPSSSSLVPPPAKVRSSSLFEGERGGEEEDATTEGTRERRGGVDIPVGAALDLRMHAIEQRKDPSSVGSHAGPDNLRENRVLPFDAGLQEESLELARTTVRLPKHLNKLLAKISGHSVELREDELDGVPVVEQAEQRLGAVGATESGAGALDERPGALPATLQAKRQFLKTKNRLAYGALMDKVDNDLFAQENALQMAGEKFERHFARWEGMHLLDRDSHEANTAREDARAAMVVHGVAGQGEPGSMHIPRIGQDSCCKCGATLQGESEDDAGFVAKGDVERYIERWQEVYRLRAAYADRMHELQGHWDKHGRRVGEEWLDFMTQDEFEAIYRFDHPAFACLRCKVLSHRKGRLSTRMVVRAKDFSEQLKALKEKRCLIVLVIDLCDFPGTMVPDLPGLVSMNNPVIIVANKLDSVTPVNPYSDKPPQSEYHKRLQMGMARVRKWVLDQAVRFRLPRSSVKAVIPMSGRKGWGSRELISAIERHSNITLARPGGPLPTYFVGCTNVGKSTVLNCLAQRLAKPEPPHPKAKKQYFTTTDPKTGKESIRWRWDYEIGKAAIDLRRAGRAHTPQLTTSTLPGTTVKALALNVSLSSASADSARTLFYDTPGVYPHWAASTPLTLTEQMKFLPRGYIRPTLWKLAPGSTLFYTGLCCIDVVKGPPELIFFAYLHPKAGTVRVTETARAKEYWHMHVGKTLTPPSSPEQVERNSETIHLTESRSYLFECFNNRRHPKADVYFCGMGHVSFFTSGPGDVVLRVRTAAGVIHGVRDPLRTRDMLALPPWPRIASDATAPSLQRQSKAEVQPAPTTAALGTSSTVGSAASVLLPEGDAADGARPSPLSSSGSVPAAGTKEESTTTATATTTPEGPASALPFDELLLDLRRAGALP